METTKKYTTRELAHMTYIELCIAAHDLGISYKRKSRGQLEYLILDKQSEYQRIAAEIALVALGSAIIKGKNKQDEN